MYYHTTDYDHIIKCMRAIYSTEHDGEYDYIIQLTPSGKN